MNDRDSGTNDTNDTNSKHAWYSKKMYTYTNTLYIWENKDNKLVQATIISNSNTQPMEEGDKSIYTDFVYLGPVTKWLETKDIAQRSPHTLTYNVTKCSNQKKIYYPAPIPY